MIILYASMYFAQFSYVPLGMHLYTVQCGKRLHYYKILHGKHTKIGPKI